MDASELAERLFQNTTAALEMYAVYLGEQLGYYRALADGLAATSTELAERTGTAERYTREWLEHQAAVGLLEVDDTRSAPHLRRYLLPPEHVAVLADRDDVLFSTPAALQLARYGRRLADVADAYRTGGAPPPLEWGPEGRADTNRALFRNLLGKQWLPAIPDVDRRLRADPPARVADIACGMGWSSIAMALAYPSITVDGVDLDGEAITAARRSAEEAGVAARTTFSRTDAAQLGGGEPYDLVTIIEALHDMAHPVDVLLAARDLVSENGTVLVVDVLADEEFTVPASRRERCDYGWSLIACLPDAMGDPSSAATGTVMRPATLREYAKEAGFRAVETLPIETAFWRFYRLTR